MKSPFCQTYSRLHGLGAAKVCLLFIFAWSCGYPTNAAVDFTKEIKPIFENRCYECHGSEKQKGKLRLDLKQSVFKEGRDDPVIVPGDATKGELYRRITLPPGDDDIMPNEGDPLTKAQIDLIREWINQGAPWPDDPKAAEVAVAAAPKEEVISPGPKPTPAELKAVAELAKLGVNAQELAINVNWRQANFRTAASNATPRGLVLLKDMLNLYELDLAGTKLSDPDLANISGLTNLHRLHLEHTPVTDAGLANLKGLVHLEYLNLFDTAVTDAGLKHLTALTNLKNLYLFETKVTDAGGDQLKQALPHLDVNRGWDIKELVKKEEPEKPKEPEPKKENN